MNIALTRRFAVALALLIPIANAAAPPRDPNNTIHQFLDAFNRGDMKAADYNFSSGDVSIIDHFPPHLWTGPAASQAWALSFDKDALAKGITEPSVKYATPTRMDISGDLAYVVLPTTYLYKQNAKRVAEEGQMTFALHAEDGAWKIRAWTWTGAKPHPAK